MHVLETDRVSSVPMPSTEARPRAPRASLTSLIGSRRAEILRLATVPITCGQIAKHLFMAPGGVTHHLRTLEAAGLVRRTRRGRHVIVERTPRGSAVMALFGEDDRRTARIAYGAVLAKDGHLARAEAEAKWAIELGGRGAGSPDVVLGLVQLAELRASRADAEHVNALLPQARARLDALPGALVPAPLQHAERHLTEPSDESRLAADCDLSAREQAVLRLFASPLTQREIGRELHVSVNTIKTHARSIFRKLGVSSRREAVARAKPV